MSLERFLDAQAPVIERVMDELEAGEKTSHWMCHLHAAQGPRAQRHGQVPWPGRGKGISGTSCAGAKVDRCTQAVLAHDDKTAEEIFGSPDDLEFRSCMTLFALAVPEVAVFREALAVFYGGEADQATVEIVGASDKLRLLG